MGGCGGSGGGDGGGGGHVAVDAGDIEVQEALKMVAKWPKKHRHAMLMALMDEATQVD